MIPKAPKVKDASVYVSRARYDFGCVREAIAEMNAVARISNLRTETEKRVSRMRYSISNDFAKGFRKRPHGDDAMSIVEKQIEWLLPKIETEKREAKIAQLKAEVEILRRLLLHKEQCLAECDNSRGSSVYHEKQAMIRKVLAS